MVRPEASIAARRSSSVQRGLVLSAAQAGGEHLAEHRIALQLGDHVGSGNRAVRQRDGLAEQLGWQHLHRFEAGESFYNERERDDRASEQRPDGPTRSNYDGKQEIPPVPKTENARRLSTEPTIVTRLVCMSVKDAQILWITL